MKPAQATALLFACALLVCARTESSAGRVTHVTDGDTLKVLIAGQPIKVRLFGIDAPELGQDYGLPARDLAHDLCFNQKVRVEILGRDEYGRVVAEVKLKDGRSLNAEMLRAGLAWWYKHFAPDREDFKSLEQKARAAKTGLWNDPHPVPPWEYRDYPFCASKASRVYHPCGCPAISGRTIPPANLIRFKTEQDAIKSGRKHCQCRK